MERTEKGEVRLYLKHAGRESALTFQIMQKFAKDQWCWLNSNDGRPNMLVKVVEAEKDGGGYWTYQLEDDEGTLIDGGKYFSQAELSNSRQ